MERLEALRYARDVLAQYIEEVPRSPDIQTQLYNIIVLGYDEQKKREED